MKLEAKKLQLSSGTNTLIYALIAIGLATFGIGLGTNAERTWRSYLLYHTFFMGLGIGAMFFLVIHYLSTSGWVVGIRRVPEAMANYLCIAAIFTFVVLLGLSKIYPWTNHEMLEQDHLLHHKVGYFSTVFFALRMLAFFAVTVGIGGKIICNSLRQDEEGGVDLTKAQKKLGAIFMVTFAPLFTVFAVDMYKSFDPKWFSTMWGVYVFVGFVQAAVATMILVVSMLKKHGYLENATEEHYHDLGKYMFGFSVFWAYIAVSQYLLIWYANLPEETSFYLVRQVPGWLSWSILLPIFRFFLPFVLLLPRAAKRCETHLRRVAFIILIGFWIDLNWIIMPSLLPGGFKFAWQDIGFALGFLGLFAFWVRRFMAKHNLVPMKDPYLHESLHHHVY